MIDKSWVGVPDEMWLEEMEGKSKEGIRKEEEGGGRAINEYPNHRCPRINRNHTYIPLSYSGLRTFCRAAMRRKFWHKCMKNKEHLPATPAR
jgi:hypothetical protein